MNTLLHKKCVPCEGGMLPLSQQEAQELLSQISADWKIVDGKELYRQFSFDSFSSSMEFVNKIAALAEEEDHHPDITINYKKVTIQLTTHAIGGLSENDFIMAAKTESMKLSPQEQKNITLACEERVKKVLEKDTSGHDFRHIERVRRLASTIAKAEGADPFIVDLMALLHESADYKLLKNKTEKQALMETRHFLTELGLDEDTAEEIIYVIANQSFSSSGLTGKKLDSLAGRCMQDADRLEALGAIGVARCFVHAGAKGGIMHDPSIPPKTSLSPTEYKKYKNTAINHFYEKLFKLKDLMNTATSKKIAEGRHKFMEKFLEQFLAEWDGKI
jgi:uncharacterized protein